MGASIKGECANAAVRDSQRVGTTIEGRSDHKPSARFELRDHAAIGEIQQPVVKGQRAGGDHSAINKLGSPIGPCEIDIVENLADAVKIDIGPSSTAKGCGAGVVIECAARCDVLREGRG